jgi:cbb3-type cytochrome oxidase subunit 3
MPVVGRPAHVLAMIVILLCLIASIVIALTKLL